MNRLALIVAFVLVFGTAVSAQDRVIGLLALPEVFGDGPCARFEPQSVPLYAAADGKQAIGTIEVDQNWSFAPHGGCEGLEVSVHQGAARSELPTREFEYEAPAAIALDSRGLMFKIRLSGNRSAWVQAPAARFMSYESLLEEFTGVTFFTEAFTGELRNAPALTVANRPTAKAKPGLPARVIESRRVGDRLWLNVEVFNHSLCLAGANGPPETIARGWLLAYADDGEPTVWFSSRGC
jgi:hypothetical protein